MASDGTVVVNQPGVFLVDEDGNLVTRADGVAVGSAEGLILMGKDGANARMLAVDSSGNLAALPLPAGAATEATLATRASEATLATRATEATLATRATEATLATRATEATLLTRATEATLATRATAAAQTDGSQKTQVVDGVNVLDVNASGQAAIQNPPNLDAAASTLATAANQTNGTQKSIARSGAKGTATAADITSNPINANTEALHVDGSNVVQPVSVASLPLPAGAATEATLLTRATEATLLTRATEATLATRASEATLLTRATEATLLTRATEATLTSIKDTDGIKKITDALPVGDNVIGRIIQTDAQNKGVIDDIVGVEFIKQGVVAAGPTYFCVIDLNNASGDYKHTETGSIQLAAFSALIDKSSSGAQWNARIGIILAIDGVNVTIGFLGAGSVTADNTAAFLSQSARSLFPLTISMEVSAGDFTKIASNAKVTNTDLTTASLIEDVSGGTVTPEVGDFVARLQRTSGGGTATFAYNAQYRTVA